MTLHSFSDSLASVYASYGTTTASPVIGITANYADRSARLADDYYRQVLAAGGTPLLVPPAADVAVLKATLDRLDGLLLSGGADINPLLTGEEPHPLLGGICDERDLPELLLARMACDLQLPVLGICRGVQTLVTALGGSVAQDLSLLPPPPEGRERIKHSQQADRGVATHSVSIAPQPHAILHRLYAPTAMSPSSVAMSSSDVAMSSSDVALSPTAAEGSVRLLVNSFHHQAVSQPGPHLRVAAVAPDGVIEAVESSELKPLLGVQWHPECMADEGLPLFRWLVDEARLYRRAQRLHDGPVLSLDTHCDTPMVLTGSFDTFLRPTPPSAEAAPGPLVTLPGMQQGRLDATVMVAYLPQAMQQQGGCRDYADAVFDRIEQAVRDSPDALALARTPADLARNKAAGRKSIMLGIENGLALEGRLRNVRHFWQRGVVYITLCHNGDNDLCDSARGQHTHGGLSPFGVKVVRQMNRLGMLVDLSHAAETSFYDALQLSRVPIVCSHSSCRALCDHPRNLTDDQLRALARAGGVCQITLYPGFLAKPADEATILSAMDHLDHAVRLVGVEHVGLGTDFDGDGGVRGLACAAELTLFTRQLLRRRYSDADIRLIWGGNFLRVMAQAQQSATQSK